MRRYYKKHKAHLKRRMKENYIRRGSKYRKQQYAKHRDKLLVRAKEWRLANPKKKRLADKRYYWNNVESLRKKARAYQKAHREELTLKSKVWAKQNPGKRKATWTRYNHKHPGQMTKWRKKNPGRATALNHRLRAIRQNSIGSFTRDEWRKVKNYYAQDGICRRCGKKRKMTIDHIIPVIMGGHNYLYNIQPLCRNCNSSKRNSYRDYRGDGGKFSISVFMLYHNNPEEIAHYAEHKVMESNLNHGLQRDVDVNVPNILRTYQEIIDYAKR